MSLSLALKNNWIFMPAAVVLSLLGALLLVQPAHAYTNSNMIDDGIFDDYKSMSESQIRKFINERPDTCLPKKGSVFKEPKNYFDYGPERVDAARVIYKAARYWKINPQVILTTLQKEQSLLTDNDCQDGNGNNSLNKAMGYGCFEGPGADCPLPQYSGFHKQVMKGSWQLKFNKERAVGNVNWNSAEGDHNLSYTGPFTKGNRQTKSGAASVYYDGYWTVDGKNTYIRTGGTASLYSYTPHLNQSFPSIFESYFGPSTADYYAIDYYRYKHQKSFRQNTVTAELWFKNGGSNTWYDKSGLSAAPPGTRPVYLYTARKLGRESLFGKYWNNARNIASYNFDAVYESDGSTLASNQHRATKNQIVKYVVTFRVPSNATFKKYKEFFQPSVYKKPDYFNDPKSFINITVKPMTYHATDYHRYKHRVADRGDSFTNKLLFKNTGTLTWYDKTGRASAPAGTRPVYLYTARKLGRRSAFGSTWNTNRNIAGYDFSRVLNANGSLASNQHRVKPGQIARYDVPFTVPSGAKTKTYKEFFQPSVYKLPSKFNDPASYLNVRVRN